MVYEAPLLHEKAINMLHGKLCGSSIVHRTLLLRLFISHGPCSEHKQIAAQDLSDRDATEPYHHSMLAFSLQAAGQP